MSEVILEQTTSFFRSEPGFFLLGVLLSPAVIGLFMLLYGFLKHKNQKLVLTDDELSWQTGILSKSSTEVRLESVRTVKVERSLVQRMFGVGLLQVFTAGDDAEIFVNGLADPERLRDLIRQYADD